MDGGGFEPPKQFAADLQSVPFGHSGNHPYYLLFSFIWFMQADDRTRTDNLLITNQLLCQLSHIGELLIRTLHNEWDLQGSNLWPSACKADALPAELRSHIRNILFKRPGWDSNPRPPPWQGGALTSWATRPNLYWRLYIYPQNHILNDVLKPIPFWLSPRPISISQLHTLLHFHL